MPIWQNSGIQRFEPKKACRKAGFFGIGTKKRRAEDLGHATASFALDVYGHVSEKMKQDSANRMEAYMRGTVYGKAQNG